MTESHHVPPRLHIVDAHCDTIWAAPKQERDFTRRCDRGHLDIPRLQEAGVVLQFFALFSDPAHGSHGYIRKALQMLDAFYQAVNKAESLWPLFWRHQIERVRSGHGVAGLLAIEGGEALGGSVEVLRCFYRLGVRSVGLTWNGRNELADGQMETGSGGGLTRAGVEIVAEMERLGMLIDVSHLSDHGFWHVLEVTTGPVIASHSNARGQCNHLRNLTDEQIRALAQRGGFIGINFVPEFLREGGKAQIDDIIRHIDHMASVVGNTAHIGIGSDFDGVAELPAGIEHVGDLPRIAEALARHGYADADIRGIMGENILRVLEMVLPESDPMSG